MRKKIILAYFCTLFCCILSSCVSKDQASNTKTPEIQIPAEIPTTEITPKVELTDKPFSPPKLLGKWKSESPERAGNGRYSTREYLFTENRWESTYTLASDKDMKNVLFIHRSGGSYFLQNPSKRIPGTYLISFKFNFKKLISLISDKNTLKDFGFENCGLIAHQETDIGTKGCGIIPRISECSTDFDLVKEESPLLLLGDRPAEMTNCSEDKRPYALGYRLIKIQ